MKNPPRWFFVFVSLMIVWNLLGLFAVIADLRLTAADIAALPPKQQALYAARPIWSVYASVVAVVGGTAGCIALVLRRRWANLLLIASLAGIVFQDLGLFLVAGDSLSANPVALIMQSVVLLIAVMLIGLCRLADSNAWLRDSTSA